MTQRYEAVAVREYERNGEKKTSFTNIGVAFPMKERDGFSVRLHAMPAPVDGEFTILLLPPKPKDDQQRQPAKKSGYDRDDPRTGLASRDLDDEIPF